MHASCRPSWILATVAGALLAPTLAIAAPPSPTPNPALRDPHLATATAPDTYRVKLETTKGDAIIEVHREWAPHAADRFYNLVRIGYYDGAKFFRVLSGFMAQVGMNGDPDVTHAWAASPIPDDEVRQSNIRGMVTFAAKAAPNSRTSQIFINYGNNSFLDGNRFAPFGQVVSGMEALDQLYSGYGEGAPQGTGPSQGRILAQGNAYLDSQFPELDSIKRATIVGD